MPEPKFQHLPWTVDGQPLRDRGTELYTTRHTGVTDAGTALSLAAEFKEVLIHVEAGGDVLLITGTVTGSTAAHISATGTSYVVPICVLANQTFLTYAAPTGTTVNVSLFAWR